MQPIWKTEKYYWVEICVVCEIWALLFNLYWWLFYQQMRLNQVQSEKFIRNLKSSEHQSNALRYAHDRTYILYTSASNCEHGFNQRTEGSLND